MEHELNAETGPHVDQLIKPNEFAQHQFGLHTVKRLIT